MSDRNQPKHALVGELRSAFMVKTVPTKKFLLQMSII